MFSLELNAATATLEKFVSRKETHGAERRCAATLKMSTAQSADVLAHFHPDLKDKMFKVGSPDLLGDRAMVKRDPNCVYPEARDEEMFGAEMRIAYGVGPALVFPDCALTDFRLTPMDGGTVVIVFNVHTICDEVMGGKLHVLNEEGITLTIEPAELPEIKAA